MQTALIYTIVSILIISLVSLIGVLTLSIKRSNLEKILLYLVAFYAGSLIGDTFIHLVPQAFGTKNNEILNAVGIFLGIIIFFVLEKFLRWRHCHDLDCQEHPKQIGFINLVGGTVHNIIDGLIIGASFAISIPLGIATTLAVIFHEIPHELGDFGILLHSGFTVKSALFYNYLSSAVSIIFAILAFYLGSRTIAFTDLMVPITIGGFIYIAMSDLIPELHQELEYKKSIGQVLCLLLGFGFMYLLIFAE